jgi:RNA polymerase sigma-70 factor (ECF subfamily)
MQIDATLLERCYGQAKGERWRAPKDRFARALENSAERAFTGRSPEARELERYLTSLHLEDLALACACAAGDDAAWEHFVLAQRPVLYRAADALDSTGGSRDLADALYGELFGLRGKEGERRSLFRYFHGRSSLTTWLRAVLAQRYVDRLRANQRSESLPEEESASALRAPSQTIEPNRERYLELIRAAMKRAVADLPMRDRLRLACYYAQDLTLAQTGKVLGEHEATVSRGLARTRPAIRKAVERDLGTAGLTNAEIVRCFECVSEDAGPLSVHDMLDTDTKDSARKETVPDRST